jgi:hypothetical protein
MKNKLLLSLTLGLAGASSLMASTVDIYLTGSTAFRGNCYTACQRLFVGGAPTIYYGDAAHGGTGSGWSSTTASWVMTGTPITGLTNLQGNTLNIHGLFTGSIQGLQTVEQKTKLIFPAPSGTPSQNCNAYVTNTPTIGFSDASGASAPFPVTGNYLEENVCVQPFVFVKANSGGVLTNINNVSLEQMVYGIPNGRIPLSAWTYQPTDTNTFIYLLQRTKDSGTRRCETADMGYQYNDTVGIYIYDTTANNFYLPSVLANNSVGLAPNGVIGTAGPGLGNANMNWGYGYIGGGDIKSALGNANAANTSISYLSIADGKGIVSGNNWSQVVSYNGVWPTLAGAGIHGNTGTNDYSPVTQGYYPLWGLEVLVHPINPGLIADQNVTASQLGDQTQPGTFMGLFNAQTAINGGSPLTGSIENEIELTKPAGATAIRLSDMRSNRQTGSAIGGEIYPF